MPPRQRSASSSPGSRRPRLGTRLGDPASLPVVALGVLGPTRVAPVAAEGGIVRGEREVEGPLGLGGVTAGLPRLARGGVLGPLAGQPVPGRRPLELAAA